MMERKLMRSYSEKMSIQMPIKKVKVTRLLITVNVLGSAGPLRFVVGEEDKVAKVVDTALKQYAREGRLPVLSSDVNDFFFYSASAGIDGYNNWSLFGVLREVWHQPTWHYRR